MTKNANRTPSLAETKDKIADAELDKVAAGSGAGAGKVTFNPFSITRKID